MLLATFCHAGDPRPRLGAIDGGAIVDLRAAYELLERGPAEGSASLVDMVSFFEAGEHALDLGRRLVERASAEASAGSDGQPVRVRVEDVRVLAPVPRPRRLRDYLTHPAHFAGAGGGAVPEACRQFPVGYNCNHEAVIGPEDTIPWPAYSDQLDFELEIGFFVGRGGRDITVAQAPAHIAGITIFNDVSARDIQLFEMSAMIGPGKGKNFCNVLGPAVLTMDEVDEAGMQLTARVNGDIWVTGSLGERSFSFAEVLAWASFGEDVVPGEFIATGTIGGGCGIELDRWLQPGDVLELEAAGIGVLRNPIGPKESARPGVGLPTYAEIPPPYRAPQFQ